LSESLVPYGKISDQSCCSGFRGVLFTHGGTSESSNWQYTVFKASFFLIFVIICMNTLMLEVNKSTVLFFAFQKLGPGMAMQEFPEIG